MLRVKKVLSLVSFALLFVEYQLAFRV
jgi:hypothetical protein